MHHPRWGNVEGKVIPDTAVWLLTLQTAMEASEEGADH